MSYPFSATEYVNPEPVEVAKNLYRVHCNIFSEAGRIHLEKNTVAATLALAKAKAEDWLKKEYPECKGYLCQVDVRYVHHIDF